MFTGNSAEALHDPGGDSGNAIAEGSDKERLVVRYATSADITEYFGGLHRGTLRGVVAVLDGRVVGIVGVVREGPIGKFFSDHSEELVPHLRSIKIMRGIKLAQKMCEEYRGPLVSIASTPEGCKILHRLGFTHLTGDLYGWLK